MHCRNYLLFILSLLLAAVAFSQEEPNPNSLNEDYSGKQSTEWEKIQQDLVTVKGKLEAQTSMVLSLIEAKNSLKGKALDGKLDELKIEHQKLQKYTEEYNRKNHEYLTKFPERGIKDRRTYRRLKAKSLQAFENEMTIQGRVNRLHAKILSQYPKKKTEIKSLVLKSQDATKVDSLRAPEKSDVTDQIQFKK